MESVRETIVRSIKQRNRLRVVYKNQSRLVEPYLLFESQAGDEILHSWQTEGEYEKTPPPDWCNMKLSKISLASTEGPYEQTHPDYNPDGPKFHRIIVSTPKTAAAGR